MRVYWGRCGLKRAKKRFFRNRAVEGEVIGSGGSVENRRFGEIATLTFLFVVILSVAAGVSCDGKGARTSSGAGYAGSSQKTGSGYESDVSGDRSLNPLENSGQIQPEIAIPLDEVISEIESFSETGAGGATDEPAVDPQVFEMLKAELVKKLTELYGDLSRVVSRPPEGASGAVTDLVYDFESNMLSWTYVNRGDYDMSGEVGVSDITAIAQYYLADSTDGIGDDAREAWIDGNGNGEVGISDITTIAENFLCTVAGYRIVTSSDPDSNYDSIGEIVLFGEAGVFPKTFSVELPSNHLGFNAVVPVDGDGNGIAMSNAVEFPQTPTISGTSPVDILVNTETVFTVDVVGSEPYTYEWTFGTGVNPETYTDAAPHITATIIGEYTGFVKVSNIAGSDVEYFTYNVWDTMDPPEIISIDPVLCEDGKDVTFSAVVTGTYGFTYDWDFGGGAEPNTSDKYNPSVTTGAVGEYYAALTVTNYFGSDTENFKLTIVDALVEPSINSIKPDGGFSGEQVQFTASVGGSDEKYYAWDFKGATEPPISTDKSPLVTLGAPGDYPIKLTVSNFAGRVTYDMTLIITDPTAPPVIRSVSPLSIASGSTTTFKADVRGKPPISYWWDFGGGGIPNTTSEESPTVTMRDSGEYNCALTVENEFGLDTIMWTVTVEPMWHQLEIDTDGNQGDFPSLALDSNGYAYFCYYDGTDKDLKYGYVTGSSWSKMTLDSNGNVGQYSSLALDSSDEPHIAYYDATNMNLKYISKNGADWTIETIDSGDDVGRYASIAVDSFDRPHISYFDGTNGDLKHANFDGSSWYVETLDTENVVGRGTSIAIDSLDRIHIAYSDHTNLDLKYALFEGGAWTIATIDSVDQVGLNPSIAIDLNNHPHISHGQDADRGEYYLKYSYFTGSKWVNTIANGVANSWNDSFYGGMTSIDVDSQGYPYICYYNYLGTSMKLTYYSDSKWNYEYPQLYNQDLYSYANIFSTHYSLKLDNKDNIHICFYESWQDNLFYIWYG